jgi:hypothetical protein
MSEPTDPRVRLVRTAGVLTALVGLVVLAVSLPWGSKGRAAAGDAGQPTQDPAALSCQQTDPQDTRAAISELMQDIKEQKARENPDAGSEWVVLNNRGYNYGPPPEVDIDPFVGPRAPAEPAESPSH